MKTTCCDGYKRPDAGPAIISDAILVASRIIGGTMEGVDLKGGSTTCDCPTAESQDTLVLVDAFGTVI